MSNLMKSIRDLFAQVMLPCSIAQALRKYFFITDLGSPPFDFAIHNKFNLIQLKFPFFFSKTR